MKEQDLVLEAVKAFPVWPDGATHILKRVINSKLEAARKDDRGFLDLHSGNDIYFRSNGSYQIASTREQHIRKRVEIYEGVKVEWLHYVVDEVTIPRPTPEELAYIAEIDEKNKDSNNCEWVPEVGQECEFSCTAIGKECEWRLGLIEYLSPFTCVINPYDAEGEFVAHPVTVKLRSPKTEAEKEKERVVSMAWGGFNLSLHTSKEHYIALFEQLYDNGMLVDPNK